MKSLTFGVLAALGLAVSSNASAERPQARGGVAQAGRVAAPSSPQLVFLYDQTSNPSGANISSQDFQPAFDLFDAEAADDFVVPSGAFWSIEQVFIPGAYSPGGGPAAAVHLTFYADGGGAPSTVVCQYPLQTPLDGAGAFIFDLESPCVLRAGTYWMVVQARQDNTAGQWFWNTRSVQSNNAAQWRNPLNGFATGCINFSPMQSCVAGIGLDLLFWLAGTPGGVVPPAPTECGTTTAYSENASAVPIGDNTVVTSTIGISGLTGPIWDVNVLTDILHTYPGDIDMTIQSPEGTVVTLSTDNAGDHDDVFHGTVWDDQASPGGQVPYASSPRLVNDHPYANGVRASPLAPEEALFAFFDEDPNGTWTLTIADDAGGDVGTLIAWGLQIATLPEGISTSFFTFPSNNIALPIADLGGVSSAVDASGHPGPFLCELQVTTNITHTYPGDLDMTLTSPLGTSATLSTDNAGNSVDAFAGTTWHDDVNPGGQVPYLTNDGLATDTSYVPGTPVANLVPEEALAVFLGEDPRGTWTLTISDDAAGDAGTLNSWSLSVKTCTCATAVADRPLRVDEYFSSGTSNVNGVFETGETVYVEPSWFNPGANPFSIKGVIVVFDGLPGPTYTVVDMYSDYGTVAPGATANCFDTTGDCFELQLSGARPAQHWDARFQEAVHEISLHEAPTAPEAVDDWMLHVGESFPDVPIGNQFYTFVENIFHNGVTGGCATPPNYCPGDFTLRKQMAVFVLKAKDGPFYAPPPAVGIFTDVPAADPFAPWIEELYNRGVAAGCGAGPTYCPESTVLRQQMAVFLLKTLVGSAYTPPAALGLFDDVPPGNPFAPWIEDLYNRGFAAGCGGNNFCPTNSTTRGQMAPFLVKTFGLRLYGP